MSLDQYDSLGRWNEAPLPGARVLVRAQVTNPATVQALRLYYATGWVGNFGRINMLDNGMSGDSLAGDGIYGAYLPGQAAQSVVRYYVEAVATNTAQSVTYYPPGAEHDVMVYRVQGGASRDRLVINEIMALNQGGPVDDNGESEDWIELHNRSNASVDAGGYWLTDNPANLRKWSLPLGTRVPAGGYLVIWADEDSSQGPLHANFKLSALGETLYLYDSNLVLQDELIFAAQVADSSLARIPNGSGPFVRRPHTIAANNNWALGVETTQARQPLLTLYPNPAQDILRVRLNLLEDASPWRIELVDVTGRVHRTHEGWGGDISLSVEGMTAGTYWLRLSHGDRLYLRSWIKR